MRWTKKNNETHYGYKSHINADEEHKLIQEHKATRGIARRERVRVVRAEGSRSGRRTDSSISLIFGPSGRLY
jgi:transposase, IS5 family